MALDLRNCDCMKLMSEFPDKHFDLAIVDPPYGIGMSDYKRNILNPKFDMTKRWDYYTPDSDYFNELFRVSKNQIVWGGNYFTQYLPPSKGWIFWNKKQNGNLQIGELAWTSFDRVKYFERIWQLDRNWQTEKIHPTQKPKELYTWILNNYPEQGDKILDTHLGSMSIALACHDFKFDLTGSEIDKEYFEAGMKRVSNHVSQLSLLH